MAKKRTDLIPVKHGEVLPKESKAKRLEHEFEDKAATRPSKIDFSLSFAGKSARARRAIAKAVVQSMIDDGILKPDSLEDKSPKQLEAPGKGSKKRKKQTKKKTKKKKWNPKCGVRYYK